MPSTLLKFLKPKPSHAWWLLVLVLGLFGMMGYFGYQAQIKAVLDQPSLSFKLGSFRISPYIFIKSLLTVVVLFWIAGLLTEFSSKQIHAIRGMKPATRTLIVKFLQILIYVICGLLSLRVIGIDLTTLAVFGGALGIGVGLGLQKIASNFFSGLILLFERALQIGDLVQLADGTLGYVRFMGARHILIEAFDGKEVMVPNEEFITNRLTNLTYTSKKAQIEIRVGVAYGSDLPLAQRLMLEAAEQHPRTIKEPQPSCFLNEFGDNGVLFLLYFWVEDVTEGRFSPKSDVMFAIWRKFREHGIEMPFPQRDVYIKSGWPAPAEPELKQKDKKPKKANDGTADRL